MRRQPQFLLCNSHGTSLHGLVIFLLLAVLVGWCEWGSWKGQQVWALPFRVSFILMLPIRGPRWLWICSKVFCALLKEGMRWMTAQLPGRTWNAGFLHSHSNYFSRVVTISLYWHRFQTGPHRLVSTSEWQEMWVREMCEKLTAMWNHSPQVCSLRYQKHVWKDNSWLQKQKPCEKYQAKEIELVNDSMKVLIVNTCSPFFTKTPWWDKAELILFTWWGSITSTETYYHLCIVDRVNSRYLWDFKVWFKSGFSFGQGGWLWLDKDHDTIA